MTVAGRHWAVITRRGQPSHLSWQLHDQALPTSWSLVPVISASSLGLLMLLVLVLPRGLSAGYGDRRRSSSSLSARFILLVLGGEMEEVWCLRGAYRSIEPLLFLSLRGLLLRLMLLDRLLLVFLYCRRGGVKLRSSRL